MAAALGAERGGIAGRYRPMSNRAQITQQAARDGVPAPAVERDYVLAHIIAGLGSLGDKHGLVFKGGTALRLCYFEDYRYSADLDFSVVEGDLNAAYKTVEAALAAVSGAVDALALTDEEPKRIAYKGPLSKSNAPFHGGYARSICCRTRIPSTLAGFISEAQPRSVWRRVQARCFLVCHVSGP